MDGTEFRVLFKYYFMKSKTSQEVKQKLVNQYENCEPAIRTVQTFPGLEMLQKPWMTGGPVEVSIPEIIDKIHDMVMNDWIVEDFKRRYITVDETWIHYDTPVTKR